jgi:hypothetical protein
MTRPVLIGAIVVILLGGGAAAYVLTKDDDKSPQTTSQNGSGSNASAFDAVSTEGLEFKATITTAAEGGTMEATLEHDDKNNTRYVSNIGGQQTEVIYTSDAYYTCQGAGNCTKFPLSQTSNTGVNPSDYTYDQSKIADYRNNANYKGKQDCPAGTCDVWSVSAGGVTSTIYIDTDTKRISQVESTIAGATSKIVYEYTDVTINVPTNAQNVTVPGQ